MLRNEAITITRYGAVTYAKGRPIAGAATTFTGYANIQPLNGEELLQLAEGDRQKNSIKLYTDTIVLKNNDILTNIDGKTFELQSVKDYFSHIIPHCKAIGLEQNE